MMIPSSFRKSFFSAFGFGLFFILTGLAGCSNGGEISGPVTNRNLPEGYEDRYHEGMRYGIFIPPSYEASKTYPLILVLHGSTDTTSWDLGWYHDPIQSTDPVFVITPKSLVTNSGWGTSWVGGYGTDLTRALEIVDEIRSSYNIDPNRLYVYGTSMGGFGTFNLLSKQPGVWAGAFAICGGGNPETAAAVAQTPLWIFHGSDDPIVPVAYSRNMYRAILEAGGTQVRYTEYPGVDHAAWEPAWDEPSIETWLLAQKKGVNHSGPTPVQNFRHELVNNRQVRLKWDPPTNATQGDGKVWFYRIYRDNSVIAEIDQSYNTYLDYFASTVHANEYTVTAVNFFFKESVRVSPITVTIPAGKQ